jgi:acyl-CoA thioesterase I
MRVLLVTDSLGLPRDIPEGVNYNETWTKLLSFKYETCHLGNGGATIKRLYEQMNYYRTFNPDIVVIQSGIVDATPRALTLLENEIINNFSFTKKLANIILKPKFLRFLRRYRNITYTKSSKFKSTMLEIKEMFLDKKIIWIEILPIQDFYEMKVPGIKRNVKKFNSLINEIYKGDVIQLIDIPMSYIMSDGIHLNQKGNDFLFTRIDAKLMMLNKKFVIEQ